MVCPAGRGDSCAEFRVESLEFRLGVSAKRTHFIQCDVGRGDPTPPQKPSPWGGRWRACAPDEGETPGKPPSSVTFGDSFPQRGKP